MTRVNFEEFALRLCRPKTTIAYWVSTSFNVLSLPKTDDEIGWAVIEAVVVFDWNNRSDMWRGLRCANGSAGYQELRRLESTS